MKKLSAQDNEICKLAVVGAGGVGKSAITIQFVQNLFVEYDPTIEDSYIKHTIVDGIPVFLEIMDTAGQKEYRSLRDSCIRNSQGFLIVYDITDKRTFYELNEFVERILKVKDCDKFPMVLVGNKCDLESQRSVSRDEAQMYITKDLWGVPHFETSALHRIGIDECFAELVREVRKSQPPKQPDERNKFCKIL